MKVVFASTAIFVLISCIAPVTSDQYAAAGDDQYAAAGDDQYAAAGDDQYAAAGDDQYAAAGDDQYAAAGDDQYAAAGDDQYAAAAAAAGDDKAYDNDDNGDASDAYKGFTVCDNTAIQVQDVQLYCDSPGTFYYGSGKYRNSLNCTAGDKGKYLVDFYIKDADTIESIGGNPIIDMSGSINVGWFQSDQKVFDNEDLCSLSSLKSLSGAVCPGEGKYRISSNFYWEDDGSYDGYFYPTLTIGFKSSIYQNTYDYGGANTPYCSGTTFFTSWTNTVKKVYANSIANFFKTFGILAFTIAVMLSFVWLMVKKPVSFQDARTKMGFRKRNNMGSSFDDDSSYANSDDFDFDKMKSPRANQSFLDF